MPTRTVAVSGGFDPVHRGHIRYFKAAAKLGTRLVVFLNSDEWLVKKKGYCFMKWEERREVLTAIRWVAEVLPVDDADGTVAAAIRRYRPQIFANGGDRVAAVAQEAAACSEVGCRMVFGVGGGKIQSSSSLVKQRLSETIRKEVTGG